MFVVERALGRNNPKERSFRNSERKLSAFLWCLGCNVVVLSLWWLFGPKKVRNLQDPSRTFVGNHKPSGNLRDPSSSFEDLRGTPAKLSGNLRDPSSSFGGLQDKPSRNLRDPSSSFEVVRKAPKRSFAPKMAKSERKRPLQPEWSQFAQMMPRCAETWALAERGWLSGLSRVGLAALPLRPSKISRTLVSRGA